MGIGSMKGGLHPLIRGGSATSGLPSGIPTLASARPSNGVMYFEDFFNANVGEVSATFGGPQFVITNLQGTNTAGCNSSASNPGILQLITGTTTSDGLMVDAPARASVGRAMFVAGSTDDSLGMWRVGRTGGGTGNWGFGWVDFDGVALGADWVTDPDTTLAGTNSIVFTCHEASYSGDNALALVARVYESTGTDNGSLALGLPGTSYNKIEMRCKSAVLSFYFNGVFIGTLPLPTMTANSQLRFSGGIRTTTAASRTFSIDAYFQEYALSSAR